MYHKMILQKTYFDNAKFNENTRVFKVFDFEGDEIIKAFLGTTFESGSPPFHCLSEDYLDDGSICLEWTNLGRLYMNFNNLDVFRCYMLKWQSLGEGVFPTDCYELSRDGGLWFGGGLTSNADWNLNTANFSFAPFITGDAKVHQFGNALKRYFINSRGVSIEVSDQTPFHLSITKGKKEKGNENGNTLCIRAANDEFAFVNKLTPLPELEYKVCIAEDMKSLHNLMTQKSLWDGLKESDYKRLEFMLEEPVWRIPHTSDPTSINEMQILNFSESVISMGSYMKLGHILVNEFWQDNIGDFTVDQTRFPSLQKTIDLLHRRGFKIIFTVQPFISTDSPNFKDAVKKKLLIYERYSERSIPALTRYRTSSSAGVLDITNNDSVPWLFEKLQALKDEYQIDSFYFDMGTGYNLPHYYQCRKTLVNPDEYARIFTSSFESLGIFGVSTATAVPKPPSFVSLPAANSSWDNLRTLVTTTVNYGVVGYPFVMAGAVGGDYVFTRNTTKMMTFYSLDFPPLPSEELYIRWLQIEIFLPSMSFSHLPIDYKSDYVTETVKDLISIRQKTVIPVFKKFLQEALNDGLSLVRPLWMLDPHDSNCININDEFSVGGELLVAPIFEEGSESREGELVLFLNFYLIMICHHARSPSFTIQERILGGVAEGIVPPLIFVRSRKYH